LASFCVWTKSLKCKDVVNRDSTFSESASQNNSSSLSAVWTIEPSRPDAHLSTVPSRPDAHLSTVPSVRTTCHTVRTLDRPASTVRTKCSFRSDPILYREVFCASLHPSGRFSRMSRRLPVLDQLLISFQVPRKGTSFNRPDDVVSRPDAQTRKGRIAIQI